jgi:hypothetical protein
LSGAADVDPDQPATLHQSGRWIALTAAAAVLAVAAVGAVTLLARHEAIQSARTNKPSVTARPSNSAPANVATAGQNQLVVDQAAATAPGEAAITATLNRYFNAINNRDYLTYKRTFIMALRGGISPASFNAGLGTTTDSSEQLRSITVIGAGQADAFVTFVSQQPTAASAGRLSCTAWSMEFFLGQRVSRYLLVAPPHWYEASNIGCA